MIPDWEKMSELDEVKYHKFAEERWYAQVLTLYNDVVCDGNSDPDSVKSYFLRQCELSSTLKIMFMTWLSQYEERGNGEVTYEEVLRFINHLSWVEQKHVTKMSD